MNNDNFENLGDICYDDDSFVSYVEFENEDGDTLTLAVVDYFDYEGELYAILVDPEDDGESEEVSVCVLRVIEHDDSQEFVEPDESKVPQLQAIVERIFDSECDCDDCGCDCEDGHHHHHHCDCGCDE